MPWERSIEHWRALPFLSVRETAAVLGLGERSVRKLIEEAALEARQVCGKTLVIVRSIKALAGDPTAPMAAPTTPALTAAERRIVRELRGGVGS